MAKSQQTFNKKEREKKRRKKKQDKLERREQRKLQREQEGKKTFEEMLSYVDENGNITSTPPDPNKKRKVSMDEIMISVPKKAEEPGGKGNRGTVKFFNTEKGLWVYYRLKNKRQRFRPRQ